MWKKSFEYQNTIYTINNSCRKKYLEVKDNLFFLDLSLEGSSVREIFQAIIIRINRISMHII